MTHRTDLFHQAQLASLGTWVQGLPDEDRGLIEPFLEWGTGPRSRGLWAFKGGMRLTGKGLREALVTVRDRIVGRGQDPWTADLISSMFYHDWEWV